MAVSRVGYGALILSLAMAAYIYAELQAPWSAAMVGAVALISALARHSDLGRSYRHHDTTKIEKAAELLGPAAKFVDV